MTKHKLKIPFSSNPTEVRKEKEKKDRGLDSKLSRRKDRIILILVFDMGGHGGLNILPQKRWNVYNYENREKVRKDEEAAAKEEQLKREQARKRDAEFRLERLRTARGLAPTVGTQNSDLGETNDDEKDKKSAHINLFEGIKIFDPVNVPAADEKDGSKRKKMRKEEAPRVVTAEDEKYRLGYGVAGKGVKLPWYLEKRSGANDADDNDGNDLPTGEGRVQVKKSGKKTLEELRAERMKREKQEKERERALIINNGKRDRATFNDRKFSRR
ncbi:hypothetical protein MLD38_019678 [Melastoma candidum]|uniref:Uncharacterized protein n=1 Tax=Melastoma candidum TaxID=119954 RepID=A0ACB9QXP4_9MYRT|nr:hypothetical protein MLD38_019678 [Melastoma candidum]